MLEWNMQPNGLSLASLNMLVAWLLPIFLWSLIWKGLALWVIARRGQSVWFIVFLLVNTAGIGEILYLALTGGFAELKKKSK